MTKKIWKIPNFVSNSTENPYEKIGISPVISDILVQRGVKTIEQMVEFLSPSLLDLASPFAFKEMDQAIERLKKARKFEEKVLIYGDYDVDGVTSTTLLYKVLTDLGFKTLTYIPNRMDEGYGLHRSSILKASQSQIKVIITVDCGITSVEEVEYAKTLGIDLILTDHHEPPEILPQAYAIINPKVSGSGYPFRDLAGVGVAFKLAQALLETFDDNEAGAYSQMEILDLVALGTIADLVPLVGENRVMVYLGLKQMENTVHLGLYKLLEECGLANKPLKAGQIAFMMAPRINAAGRMDSARAGLELLLTGREERAQELSRSLSRENALRQETEKEIFAEAVALLEKGPLPRVIVLSASNWHHGVIGIVASRLVERYYRPVFLITEDGEEGKGSARGISGYHVLNELRTQADLLKRFGGHSQAAGFSLKCEDIPLLKAGLNASAEKFPEELFCEKVHVDKLVPLEVIDASLMRKLEQLAPFGFGNPNPVLAGKNVPLFQVETVGQDCVHLKCTLGSNGQWEGIAFRKGEEIGNLMGTPTVDVAFGLDWNTFRGPQSIQLLIKDIQPKAMWQETEQHSIKSHELGASEDFSAQEALEEILQGRQEIALSSSPLEFELIDWRKLKQDEWLLRTEKNQGTEVIWDNTGVKPQFFDSSSSKVTLGVISGLPASWEVVKEQLIFFRNRGIQQVTFVQSQVDDLTLRKRCGYLSREDLVQIYRVLYDLAKKKNPFYVNLDEFSLSLGREAILIFEELGLVKNLGGTGKIALEWIPAEKKLDLEASFRYRAAKQCWMDIQGFREEYYEIPWLEFTKRIELF
jgi:single-stranded-DNA-specific exonuclease